MQIQVRRTDYQEVEPLRELFRQEANCQIVHDSALRRGIAYPYLMLVDGRLAGYAAEDPPDYGIEVNGAFVASGGFLTHYNPPYGDIYMGVSESFRQLGYGSYLVQELKRVCYAAGKKPAARCNPQNIASRRTLQKAGMLPCGHIVFGEVAI